MGKVSAILVVVQVPVVGVGIVDWEEISQHHTLAALVFAVFELIVIAFVRVVWERPEKHALGAIITYIGALSLFVSRFRRQYFEYVRWETAFFNIRGLRTTGAFAHRLETIYVELGITRAHIWEATSDALNRHELAESASIWDFFRLKDYEATPLVIIGPPGCGKTTLLQNVAFTFANDGQRRLGVQSYVPVFLLLRECVDGVLTDMGLLDLIERKVRKSELNPPQGWFGRILHEGRAVVMLDGLDEIRNDLDRIKVSQWIERQVARYPRTRFIVSARPRGYRIAPLNRAIVLEVQPWGPMQVRQFVRNWYLANETMKYGRQDQHIRNEAEKQALELLKRLENSRELHALIKNPLLITMVVMVHNYRGALPGRRVELFAEVCDVLLGHWQQGKGLVLPFSAAELRHVLAALAAYMMLERRRSIETEGIFSAIGSGVEEIGVKRSTLRQFLENICASSGILLEVEPDQWSFAHLGLQEYLASAYYVEHGWPSDVVIFVDDVWWMETIRFYAAQTDATNIIEACLISNTINSLTLASEVVEDAKRLRPDMRSRVHERLDQSLVSDDPSWMRLAAEMRLRRRLRSLCVLDAERQMDLEYLTYAEYWLFVNETDADATCWPLSWSDGRFAKGSAQAPASDVPALGIPKFFAWLNNRDGRSYRLPTRDEIVDLPVDRGGWRTWCQGTREDAAVLKLETEVAKGEHENSIGIGLVAAGAIRVVRDGSLSHLKSTAGPSRSN